MEICSVDLPGSSHKNVPGLLESLELVQGVCEDKESSFRLILLLACRQAAEGPGDRAGGGTNSALREATTRRTAHPKHDSSRRTHWLGGCCHPS